jgi:hypothetical protein
MSDAAQQGDEADEAFGGMVASMDMPPHARVVPVGRGHRFAADMERPVSSPRDQVVDVVPPWGSETTVKAGRFDDESL